MSRNFQQSHLEKNLIFQVMKELSGKFERKTNINKFVRSRLLQCNSKSQLESLETESGIRYSIMIDLPLFDPISFVLHIICTFTYVS